MDIRQMIVVRKDLNMRKGKIAAQAAHASLAIFFRRMEYLGSGKTYDGVENFDYELSLTREMHEWKKGLFTKICVYVESEEELLSIYNTASEVGLPVELITDSGLTEFNGVPTLTCLAIGPAHKEALDQITGHLPLY